MRKTLIAVVLLPVLAWAQSSFQTIGYQGLLKKSDGTPETQTVSVTFRIFAAATGGTELWSEVQDVTPNSGGFYAVFLGSKNAFTNATRQPLFDGSDLYLELQIQGDSTALTPRQQISSVPYAMTAKQLIGSATGLPTPSRNSDAANKEYVDNGQALTPILTLGTGWLAGSKAPAGRVVGGVVFLKGTLKYEGADTWDNVFTLPEALRPTEARRVIVTFTPTVAFSGSQGMIMDIAPNGVASLVCYLDGSTNAFPPPPVGGVEKISLETVSFVR